MRSVEAEGSSIDEAIARGLDQLGAERDQVAIDILASPTKGVLGIGGRKAKVRVTVREPVQLDAASEATPLAPSASDTERAPVTVAVDSAPVDPQLAARAQALLQEILTRMGFEVSVLTSQADGEVQLSIDGDSSGVLIGRHGQTLDAFEYFLHRALSRDESVGRLMVDCERYRVRRREMLEGLASRLAQQAKTKRKPMTMEALSPRERRIVHLALQGQAGLTTRSSGDGYYRNLLIIPEGERRGARPPRGGSRATDDSGNR